MAIQELTITNQSLQEFFYDLEDFTLRFNLRFFPMTGSWSMTIDRDEERIVTNRKLSLGNFNLEGLNQPYEIEIVDNQNTGIDPFKSDDFSSGRCTFLIWQREDITEARGFEVE